MSFKAAFFDLGGVIVRTEYQAPRERLAERLNVSIEDLYRTVFESETSKKASLGTVSEAEHWATVAHKLGRPAAEAASIRDEFFAGDVIDHSLVDYIRNLRPQYTTGVISNAWPDMRAFIVKNKFDDAFDNMVISAEVGVMKPQPGIYNLALEQAKVRADEAIFVDDMPANIEAANALGMRGILFRDPHKTLIELKMLLD
jgi:putative hydrolase of the HAD superfamily